MKRSEMVQILIQAVLDNCYDEGFELVVDEASKILSVLENAGMLPPGAEKDKITFSKLTGEVTGFSYDKYEWEPET